MQLDVGCTQQFLPDGVLQARMIAGDRHVEVAKLLNRAGDRVEGLVWIEDRREDDLRPSRGPAYRFRLNWRWRLMKHHRPAAPSVHDGAQRWFRHHRGACPPYDELLHRQEPLPQSSTVTKYARVRVNDEGSATHTGVKRDQNHANGGGRRRRTTGGRERRSQMIVIAVDSAYRRGVSNGDLRRERLTIFGSTPRTRPRSMSRPGFRVHAISPGEIPCMTVFAAPSW